MSHSQERTVVLAPAASVAEAAEAIAAGAQMVDAGGDEALIAAIQREGIDVLDANWLICDGPAGLVAAGAGTASGRTLARVAPGEVEAAVAAGWRVLVDADTAPPDDTAPSDDTAPPDDAGGHEDTRIAAARAGAIAAICAWQGAHIVRTRHVTEVRRCLDMTEAILGIRPPAWAVRGLG